MECGMRLWHHHPNRVCEYSLKRISFLTALCLVLMAKTSRPRFLVRSKALNELIAGAEFVVVAEIIKRPEEFDMGSGGMFEAA